MGKQLEIFRNNINSEEAALSLKNFKDGFINLERLVRFLKHHFQIFIYYYCKYIKLNYQHPNYFIFISFTKKTLSSSGFTDVIAQLNKL